MSESGKIHEEEKNDASSDHKFNQGSSIKVNEDSDKLSSIFDGFGRYQKIQYVLICLPVVFVTLININYVFVVGNLDYRCIIPECDSSQNPQFIPGWWPNSTADRCLKPVLNYDTYTNQTCASDDFTGNFEECTEWVYENRDSVVADLNLACEPLKISLVGSVHNVGMLISMVISGYLSDRLGRKPTLIICAFGGLMGQVKAYATSYYMYIGVELVESALSGGAYTAAMVLLIEIISSEKRILSGILFAYSIYTGESLFAIIAMFVPNWKNLVRIIYAPPLFAPLLYFVVRESPRWQILNNKIEKAKETIKIAAKINKIDINLNNIEDKDLKDKLKIESCEKKEQIYKIFLSKELMKRVFVACVSRFTASFIYYGLMINSVLLPGSKYVNFMLATVMSYPGELLALYLMTKIGRRFPLVWGFILCGTLCVASGYIPTEQKALKITLFLMGKMLVSISFTGSVTYTMELFPTSVRGSLLGLCAVFSTIGSMLAPLTPMMKPVLSSLFFGGTCLLSGLLLLTTPETKGVPLVDTIDQINKNARTLKQEKKLEKINKKP